MRCAHLVLRIRVSEQIDALKQSSVGVLDGDHGRSSSFGHFDVAFRAATTLGRGVAHPGLRETLFLHAVDGGVKSAGGGFAASAFRDFIADGYAVSIVAEAQDCEEHDLLEFAEIV